MRGIGSLELDSTLRYKCMGQSFVTGMGVPPELNRLLRLAPRRFSTKNMHS